jgi:hypothetical protein
LETWIVAWLWCIENEMINFAEELLSERLLLAAEHEWTIGFPTAILV